MLADILLATLLLVAVIVGVAAFIGWVLWLETREKGR